MCAELATPMLNLRLDEPSGVYSAPIQKANNSIILLDDFGRQAVAPRELFNRWIVLLDRHIDYLYLQFGLRSRFRSSWCWPSPPTWTRVRWQMEIPQACAEQDLSGTGVR